jgi:hypothetical protein
MEVRFNMFVSLTNKILYEIELAENILIHICAFPINIGPLTSELIIPLGSELPATMSEDQKLMYDGWKKNGAHSREWVDKTNKFIEHAFSVSNTGITRCPCIKC